MPKCPRFSLVFGLFLESFVGSSFCLEGPWVFVSNPVATRQGTGELLRKLPHPKTVSWADFERSFSWS